MAPLHVALLDLPCMLLSRPHGIACLVITRTYLGRRTTGDQPL